MSWFATKVSEVVSPSDHVGEEGVSFIRDEKSGLWTGGHGIDQELTTAFFGMIDTKVPSKTVRRSAFS